MSEPAGAHGAEASKAVLGRGSYYTLGTAAPILTQLGVTPVVTRLLGPQRYGVVAPAIVVVQVTMMIASLGIPSVITRHALVERSGMAGARALLLRGSALTLGLVAAVLAAAPLWFHALSPSARAAWFIALVAGGFFVLVEDSQAMLRATDQPLRFVTLSLVAAFGGPLTGLALLLGVGRSPQWYLAGLAAGYAVAAALGLLWCLAHQARRSEPGDLARALRLGLPVLPHLVALFLANGALVFLAGALHGPADGGRLQLALFLGSSPAVITSALNNSWAPVVYRTAPEHRAAVIEHTAHDMATLSGLLCAGVALLAPWLLLFVADKRYSPTALVVPVAVVAVGAMVSIAYLANVHLVFASGHSLGLSVTTPLSLLIGLTAAWSLGHLSLAWVAVGFPVTYSAMAVLTGVLRRRVRAPRWREGVVLGPFAVGAAFLVLGAVLPVSGVWSLSRVAAAGVAGVLLLRAGRRILRPSAA